MKIVADTTTVFVREMQPQLRDPFALIIGMAQPLVFLFLFGPLLQKMPIPGYEGVPVFQWFVPGILVMLVLFATGFSGFSLISEMHSGTHERLLVTPLNRGALLVGRTLKEVVTLVAQAVIIIVVTALLFDFDIHVAGMLTGLLLVAVFGVGLGSLSFALAIALKHKDWVFYVVINTVLFPLIIVSGVLLPLNRELSPEWMYIMSRFNPITHLVDAERGLFAGDFARDGVLYGSIAGIAIAVIGLLVGVRAMRRASL